jgi:hypothetical protein
LSRAFISFCCSFSLASVLSDQLGKVNVCKEFRKDLHSAKSAELVRRGTSVRGWTK